RDVRPPLGRGEQPDERVERAELRRIGLERRLERRRGIVVLPSLLGRARRLAQEARAPAWGRRRLGERAQPAREGAVIAGPRGGRAELRDDAGIEDALAHGGEPLLLRVAAGGGLGVEAREGARPQAEELRVAWRGGERRVGG